MEVKTMKRTTFFALAVLLCFNMLRVTAYASNSTEVERLDYEDGSYALITLERQISRSTRTDFKTYTYYSPTGTKCFSYTLTAAFTYDGKTSKADRCYANVSYYVEGWSYTSHSEYVSGNTAYGNAVFSGPSGITPKVNLTITCDANGHVK